MFQREYEQHRKQFEKFKVVLIIECDNCIVVEKLFKKEIKLRNLNRSLIIKKKPQTELFAITSKFTHEYFIEHLKKLVEEHKLPSVKEANTKIDAMSNVLDTYKQSDKLRELEYQFKMSDNYKLEVEAAVRIKELDSETAKTVKELDIELERVKNIGHAMINGYDLEPFLNCDKSGSYKKLGSKRKDEIIRL